MNKSSHKHGSILRAVNVELEKKLLCPELLVHVVGSSQHDAQQPKKSRLLFSGNVNIINTMLFKTKLQLLS